MDWLTTRIFAPNKATLTPHQRARLELKKQHWYLQDEKLLGEYLLLNFLRWWEAGGKHFCCYCKHELELTAHGKVEGQVSIDRIMNYLGHLPLSNLVVCCYKCNMARKNYPFAKFCRAAQYFHRDVCGKNVSVEPVDMMKTLSDMNLVVSFKDFVIRRSEIMG